MNPVVVVPTFNEKENMTHLIPAIFSQPGFQGHILVVDDNSPDGTSGVVESLQPQFPGRLHLLRRSGKEGLGRAYVAGFQWALSKGYDVICEMDADFSHRPVDLIQVLKAAENHDFVVGSRWVKGGGTINWETRRQWLSKCGSFYARTILGFPLRDWTGGFNAWKAQTLVGIDIASIRSDGYSFQIELKYRALKKGFKGIEVPIIFEERRAGQSKMSSAIVREALHRVWGLRFDS